MDRRQSMKDWMGCFMARPGGGGIPSGMLYWQTRHVAPSRCKEVWKCSPSSQSPGRGNRFGESLALSLMHTSWGSSEWMNEWMNGVNEVPQRRCSNVPAAFSSFSSLHDWFRVQLPQLFKNWCPLEKFYVLWGKMFTLGVGGRCPAREAECLKDLEKRSSFPLLHPTRMEVC